MKSGEKKAEDILTGNITPGDQVSPRQQEIASGIQTVLKYAGTEKLTSQEKQLLWNSIERRTQGLSKSLYTVWVKVAAVVLLVLGIGLWQYAERSGNKQHVVQTADTIKPGGNRALLTLSDGTRIALNDLKDGVVKHEKGVRIIKVKGQVKYEIIPEEINEPATYNTITTPLGGQFSVKLPDGTQVWLNASSSLRYPTRFSANNRTVNLQGEGYFEVAKDKFRPFRVETSRQTIEVLGTHFNVQAYTNEEITRTTLIEGSVKVLVTEAGNHSSFLLKPGQQANLGKTMSIAATDTVEAISWKNGRFYFNSSTLPEVMRQLERWYNVEVDYTQAPAIHFNGVISRYADLGSVLNMLEFTGGIKFEVHNRKIRIINPINNP
ncbi:DUF4974 domain-containing protein [Pedobacter sp. BS3]|uniref:FecR family protein n=1 Tax=Pedobacter sp. BS3 TaxID=2567937 RepID=UPI0011EFED37|nr:FecR domain-containing protein [Pedobacter sp. BS3]TZF83079.1 DUF4974 domain-containing protein [Pedobacter sp. BS3]